MKLIKHRKQAAEAAVPVSLKPFWPIRRLQSEIDRLFEEPFGTWLTPDGPFLEKWMPALDLLEDKENVVVKFEMPGLKKEEFKVFISGETLNITGERKSEAEEKTAEMYHTERYFGHFHRSVALPAPVDAKKIEAHYKDGILTVTCPKTEEAKRNEIAIKVD